jgi:hypothetical protein
LVPEGNVEVVSVRVFAAIAIVSATDFVWAGLPLSLTVTVKLDVPLAVGVPEIAPVEAARLSPVGSVPELVDHV